MYMALLSSRSRDELIRVCRIRDSFMIFYLFVLVVIEYFLYKIAAKNSHTLRQISYLN